MPQVPYQPFSTVQPTSPGERVAVSTPGAAFGENIGAALSHLGTTVDQVGNEMFSRAMALQDLNNQTESREAQTNFAKQSASMVADYDALEGKAAKDGLQAHLKNLSDLRDQIGGNLSNPMSKRMFLTDTSPFLQREIFSAAKHAGEENKRYIVGEAASTIKNLQHTWTDPNDQSEVDDKMRQGNASIDTIAGTENWGPEKHKLAQQDMASQTLTGQVMAIARHGDTIGAWQKFQDYAGEGLIDQKEHDAIEKFIWNRNEAIGAKNIVNRIFSPDKSVEQMTNEIHEAAKDPKVSLGDPNFQAALEGALSHRTFYEKRQINDERHQNENVIYKAVNSGRVNDPQQLQNDPDAGPAYAALPEAEKNKWNKLVYAAAKNRDMQTETESKNTLQGMADLDPRRYVEQNLYDPQWKLSTEDRQHFISLRDRLIKQPLDDPHVKQGLRNMLTNYSTEMKDLGLVSKDTGLLKKGKDFDVFTGSLSIALKEFEAANKRPPSPEEFDEKIAKPLLKTHSEPAWFGLSTAQVPEFKRTFPPKLIDEARKKLTVEGQQPPTDAEVHRWITREQWDQFYKGSAGGEGGGPTAPQR